MVAQNPPGDVRYGKERQTKDEEIQRAVLMAFDPSVCAGKSEQGSYGRAQNPVQTCALIAPQKLNHVTYGHATSSEYSPGETQNLLCRPGNSSIMKNIHVG